MGPRFLLAMLMVAAGSVCVDARRGRAMRGIGDSSGAVRNFFLVKSYGKVTPAIEEVYARYATSLAGIAEVVIAYDSTCRRAAVVPAEDTHTEFSPHECSSQGEMQANKDRLTQLAANVPNLDVTFIGDAELHKAYPVMKDLKDSFFAGAEPAYVVSYFSLALWFRQLVTKGVDRSKVGYIWTIENDCLYAGDIGQYVRDVGQNESLAHYDLLAPWIRWEKAEGWPKIKMNTFDVPTWQVRYNGEFILRISPRLLLTLEGMLSVNAVMYGEAFASTMCDAIEWCKMNVFPGNAALAVNRPRLDGSSCLMAWNCRVTWAQWQLALSHENTRNYFYHACKFLNHGEEVHGVYDALDRATKHVRRRNSPNGKNPFFSKSGVSYTTDLRQQEQHDGDNAATAIATTVAQARRGHM